MISKSILFICIFLFEIVTISNAQTKPKTKPPAQSEMDRQMAEAMKDMDPEEKAEFQKMMKNMMPATADKTAPIVTATEFTNNKELVPKKDVARIAAISKKKLSNSDMNVFASTLYNKIMARGEAAEIAIVKSVLPKATKANDLSNASILAMMQGHSQAAMALSMKAVQLEPANANLQNNMASLLTQYGYEEQAIPVLNKLKNEFLDNSTVLNNLGQAWFGLGELDSAKLFIGMALSANPFHPEALVCGGLIDEIKGDPQKATSEYVKAMEMGPMPVLQKMLKNVAGDKGQEKIDFNKFLKNITIHEYFPKNWITIPKLSDHVNGFEKDISIQNGYATMFEKLKTDIEALGISATKETNELIDNKQSEFFKSINIIEESNKGINKMSSTAVVIQTVLLTYMNKWSQQTLSDQIELQKLIEAKREELTKSKKDETCADIDGKNDKYMAYINPIIRDFFSKKIEELRNWLNAYCTWAWYVTGNPRNIVVMSCINQTNALVNLYESAIIEQIVTAKSCTKQNSDGKTNIKDPTIPNLNCPTKISIPMGKEWQQISTASKNFDANSFGIKNNISKSSPNHTISYNSDHKSITEPGYGASVTTNAGSILPKFYTNEGIELVYNGKNSESKTINKNPKLAKTPIRKLSPTIKDKILNEILKKLLSADCTKKPTPTKRKFEVGLSNLFLSDADAEITEEIIDGKKVTIIKNKDGSSTHITSDGKAMTFPPLDIKDLILSDEPTPFEVGLGELYLDDVLVTSTEKQSFVDEIIKTAKSFINDLNKNGLQQTISTGIQVPNSFTAIKGFFQ